MQRKQMVLSILAVALFVIMSFLILQFRLDALGLKKELSAIEKSSSLDQNEKFIKGFFDYSSTQKRYEQIKPLMTERGYHSTFPSGMDLPKTDQAVTSKIDGLKSYERKISKTEIEYVSEFNQKTTFREVDSTQTILLRTKLLYVNEQGWKVDNVEFLAQISYQP